MRKNFRNDRPGRGGGHVWQNLECQCRQLLRLHQAGASTASPEWKELLSTLDPALRATAATILRSLHVRDVDGAADEATQQWMLQMIDAGSKQYHSDKPFFVYGYKTMLNICITIWRKSEKRALKRLPVDLIDLAPPPGRRAARKESRRRVSQALRHLSKEERALVADKYWRGLSSAEIGGPRGLSAAQVDQKMFQIRAKLRVWLSPDDLPD